MREKRCCFRKTEHQHQHQQRSLSLKEGAARDFQNHFISLFLSLSLHFTFTRCFDRRSPGRSQQGSSCTSRRSRRGRGSLSVFFFFFFEEEKREK